MKIWSIILLIFFIGTSSIAQVPSSVKQILLADTNINKGFIGVKILNSQDNKVLWEHNSHSYFTPASNTKLNSLYAGLKFLGDSVPGLYVYEDSTTLYIKPAGDPTFLHPEIAQQPVFEYLKKTTKKIVGLDQPFLSRQYGPGWGWSDYDESYMNERSVFPIFGNNIVFTGTAEELNYFPKRPVTLSHEKMTNSTGKVKSIGRKLNENIFYPDYGSNSNNRFVIPFVTSLELAYQVLSDTLHKKIEYSRASFPQQNFRTIYSVHIDTLLKPLMENSDNFFAEQVLLMAGYERNGVFSNEQAIDSLLANEMNFYIDQPNWADGSGLSRYNLFTPTGFTELLKHLKNDFDFERVKNILPTGGEGTLRSLYKGKLQNRIFAKTGTLNNHLGLSGYLYTKKNKILIFSILVNNHISRATPIRQSIEKFLEAVYEAN